MDQVILPTLGLFRSPRSQGPTNSGAQGASVIYCTLLCSADGVFTTYVSQESTYSPEMTSRYSHCFYNVFRLISISIDVAN